MYIVKWGGECGGYYQTRAHAPILYWIPNQKGATRFATKEEARACIKATWKYGADKPPCAKIVRLYNYRWCIPDPYPRPYIIEKKDVTEYSTEVQAERARKAMCLEHRYEVRPSVRFPGYFNVRSNAPKEYTSYALAISDASVMVGGLDAWRVVPKR